MSWIQPAKNKRRLHVLGLREHQQTLSIEQFVGLGLLFFVTDSKNRAVGFKHALTQQASTALFVRLDLVLELDKKHRQLT